MSLTSWFQWGVRQSCEAENQFVSVERVNAYAEIESEAPLESFPGETHVELVLKVLLFTGFYTFRETTPTELAF